MKSKELRLLKMNIQKFAEGGTEGGTPNPNGNEGGTEPTIDDLLARVAELETANAQKDAEANRWKAASDKASGEAATYKRRLNERMTAQEQADQAKLEAEQAKEQKIKDYEQRIAELEKNALRSERKAFFTSPEVGMDDSLASEIADAQVNGDWAKFDAGLKKHIKSVEEKVRLAVLGERGGTHAGNGTDNEDPTIAFAKNLGRKSKQVNQDILKNYMI